MEIIVNLITYPKLVIQAIFIYIIAGEWIAIVFSVLGDSLGNDFKLV